MFGDFGYGEGDFEGADFVGRVVEDAHVEGDLAGREVDLLGELERGHYELAVLVGGEGPLDGLGFGGDEFAVDVVGGEFELEGGVIDAFGIGYEGDLALRQEEKTS